VDGLGFMQIVITAKAGYTRGASWMLDAKSLVIGRSFRCDIVVDDGTVSRQHCRLQKVADGVRLEDLGSRNPALVDGVPQEDVVLKVGDEFSVGRAVFLITAVTGVAEPTVRRVTDSDTISLDLNDLGLDAIEQGSAWPGTFTDYVLLFRFSRRCSHLKSEASLCAALQDVLTTRFAAAQVGLFQENEEGWPVHKWMEMADESLIPQKSIEKAVEERRALSFSLPRPGGRFGQLFLAPMFYGDHCEGIAVLIMESLGKDGDRECALRLFSALCELMGPYVHAAREHDSLVQLNHRLASIDGAARTPLVGQSRIMKGLRTQVHEAAATPMNVLITGETGTGKELIAQAIHRSSSRSTKPYIILNCAAIPAELFESELFGYERGAFTGAQGSKKGLLAVAHTGILFLDEVGDLSPENQARILRVIEQGTYRRLGAANEEQVDVRFIAATNRPVDDTGFRSDLYHRLAGFSLHAPPLRERAEDIPILAQHFMDGLAAVDARLIRTLSEEAIEVLKQYPWPGNVRQLRNTVERIAHRSNTTLITAEDIWRDGLISKNPEKISGPLLTLQEMEREHVLKAIRTCGGNRAKAARILGISRSTLYLKLAEYGVET
jgi:Nif-specific regulatory protein